MSSNHCNIAVAPSSPVKGDGLHELNILKVKVEGAGGGSTLESTDDSGFGMD